MTDPRRHDCSPCHAGLVRLLSLDGTSIDLRPIRYQFGANPQALPGTDWDANWLIIQGEVHTADGASWTFIDPCLTTWEAREFGAWLRGVAGGIVAPGPGPDGAGRPARLHRAGPHTVSRPIATEAPDPLDTALAHSITKSVPEPGFSRR
jgi:hypothetical protein